MNSTRRTFATAAVLAAVLAPQASAQGVDLRSPDARDSAATQGQVVDLRSPDASAPFPQTLPAPAQDGSSNPDWLLASIGGVALALAAATITTTRRRRRHPAVAVRG